jgi:multiple sugar transport system ATP-binding protein
VEAMTMGDRIVVLKNGLVQQIDNPINLYNQPKNLFVAGFIGSPAMNFMKGELVKNGGLQFHAGPVKLSLPEKIGQRLEKSAARKLVMGVRPENICDARSASGGKTVSEPQNAIIDVVEPVGNEVFLYLNSGEHTLCMRTSPDKLYRDHDNIQIALELEKLHFFNAETEERIV